MNAILPWANIFLSISVFLDVIVVTAVKLTFPDE